MVLTVATYEDLQMEAQAEDNDIKDGYRARDHVLLPNCKHRITRT